MKTLYLIRHAKSSWDHPGLSDIERPLMKKGVAKSRRVINYLKGRGVHPDLIISSPAVRAIETANLFAVGLGYPLADVVVERKIYDGYYDRILDIIYATPNDIESLMIVGHNPTITNLANLFLHPGIDDMPTSCIVAICFETLKWEEVPNADARQLFIFSPKMLK
ncbi:MAG: histidine phosphatase family protein [Bacteroidales bacterium]|nr:histidine phosphatase family protein [Bacteroidales bacterium]